MAADVSPATAPLLGEPFPVELMNTIWADRDGVYDQLRDPDSALRWWRAVEGHQSVETWGPDEVHALRRVRDAVRRLAAEVTDDARPAARSAIRDRETAIAVLNKASARAPSWSELIWPADDEPRRVTRSRSDAAVAAVAAVADEAVGFFAGHLRLELRACQAPGCVLYFVRDHPRRQWCSATCGNRARVARHYQRHHRDRSE